MLSAPPEDLPPQARQRPEHRSDDHGTHFHGTRQHRDMPTILQLRHGTLRDKREDRRCHHHLTKEIPLPESPRSKYPLNIPTLTKTSTTSQTARIREERQHARHRLRWSARGEVPNKRLFPRELEHC